MRRVESRGKGKMENEKVKLNPLQPTKKKSRNITSNSQLFQTEPSLIKKHY